MDKGLASFEFLITFGIILIATGAIMSDVMDESRQTMLLSSLKSSVLSEIGSESIQNPSCSNMKIEEYNVSNDTLEINIEPQECNVNITSICNTIERDICSVYPDNNENITCGNKEFKVVVN